MGDFLSAPRRAAETARPGRCAGGPASAHDHPGAAAPSIEGADGHESVGPALPEGPQLLPKRAKHQRGPTGRVRNLRQCRPAVGSNREVAVVGDFPNVLIEIGEVTVVAKSELRPWLDDPAAIGARSSQRFIYLLRGVEIHREGGGPESRPVVSAHLDVVRHVRYPPQREQAAGRLEETHLTFDRTARERKSKRLIEARCAGDIGYAKRRKAHPSGNGQSTTTIAA